MEEARRRRLVTSALATVVFAAALVAVAALAPGTASAGGGSATSPTEPTAVSAVSIDPVIHILSSLTAHVGTWVRVNGTGFASDSPITFSVTGGVVTDQLACATNAHGQFRSCRFMLPATPEGPEQVTGTDGALDSAQTALQVSPSVEIMSAVQVNVGQTITLAGQGYSASSSITVATASGHSMAQSSCATDPTGSFSGCTATVGPHVAGSLVLEVRDADGNGARAGVVVVPSLSILAPWYGLIGSVVTLDGAGYAAHSAVTFSVPGGTIAVQSSCVTNSAGNFTGCTFTLPAIGSGTNTQSVAVTGTDADGHTNTNFAGYTEVVPVTAGAISPALPEFDEGQNFNLMANVAGGTGSYEFVWLITPYPTGSCGSALYVYYTTEPTLAFGALDLAPGTYYVCYLAIDTGTSNPPGPANGAYSPVATVIEFYDLYSGAPQATTTEFDFDQGSATLSTYLAGGSGSYSYAWYVDSSDTGSCGQSPTETYLGSEATWTTGAEVVGPGTYYYCYVATDSLGDVAPSGYTAISVYPTLVAGTPVSVPGTIDYGESATVNSATYGGSGDYEYIWFESTTDTGPCGSGSILEVPSPVSSWVTGSEITGPGTYYYCDYVSDFTGVYVPSAWAPLTVVSALSVASAGASMDPVTAGTSTTISAVATGGSGVYTYSWYGLPPGCPNPGDVDSFGCTPALLDGNNTYTLEVVVGDTNGGSAHSFFGLVVDPGALADQIDGSTYDALSYEYSYSAYAVGGTPPYTSYVWSGTTSSGGCYPPSGSSTDSFTCEFTTPGIYTLTLSVTDSASSVATTSLTITTSSGGCRPHELCAPGGPTPTTVAVPTDVGKAAVHWEGGGHSETFRLPQTVFWADLGLSRWQG